MWLIWTPYWRLCKSSQTIKVRREPSSNGALRDCFNGYRWTNPGAPDSSPIGAAKPQEVSYPVRIPRGSAAPRLASNRGHPWLSAEQPAMRTPGPLSLMVSVRCYKMQGIGRSWGPPCQVGRLAPSDCCWRGRSTDTVCCASIAAASIAPAASTASARQVPRLGSTAIGWSVVRSWSSSPHNCSTCPAATSAASSASARRMPSIRNGDGF